VDCDMFLVPLDDGVSDTEMESEILRDNDINGDMLVDLLALVE